MGLTYVVTDCEFDGPTPGSNSMLSFASVAVTDAGEILGEFEAVVAPLPGAEGDPFNMAFWRRNPDAWAAATFGAMPPGDVIRRFVAWVRSLPGESAFAAHPLAVDGPWIDYYLRRFGGQRLCDGPWIADRLFRHLPFCIASYAAGRLAWPITQCSVANYPAEWLGETPHTHRAIDDARGYAHLLKRLLGSEAADLFVEQHKNRGDPQA
jgi:hypothetical protein